MLRKDEISTPTSCLNRAADDEPIFVLRANDELAPHLVLEWAIAYFRARNGRLSEQQSAKYREAIQLANQMWAWKAAQGKATTAALPVQ